MVTSQVTEDNSLKVLCDFGMPSLMASPLTLDQGPLHFCHGMVMLALYQDVSIPLQQSKWLEQRVITHIRKATTPKEAGIKFRI